jgi:hypothetical protein
LVVVFPNCNNIIFYWRFHSDRNYSSPHIPSYTRKEVRKRFRQFYSAPSVPLYFLLASWCLWSLSTILGHISVFCMAVSSLSLFLGFIKELTKVASQGTLGLPYSISPWEAIVTLGKCELYWNKIKQTSRNDVLTDGGENTRNV